MISAFGVEHGEVSKGLKVIRVPRGRVPRGTRGPGGRRMSGAQRRTTGVPGAQTGGQKIASAARRATQKDISLQGIGHSAGKGLSNVGGFLEARPGITGTALVGGGSVAGYKILNRKDKSR